MSLRMLFVLAILGLPTRFHPGAHAGTGVEVTVGACVKVRVAVELGVRVSVAVGVEVGMSVEVEAGVGVDVGVGVVNTPRSVKKSPCLVPRRVSSQAGST